jgi:glycerophosphoryl diester phosphodiesterase
MVEFDVLRPREDDERSRSPLVVAHDWDDAAGRPRLTLAEALDAFTEPPLDRVEIDCDLKLIGREGELVEALAARGLIARAMVSTMYTESLAVIRELEPGLRRGWTYPLVTRAWDRSRLLRPAVLAAMARMRSALPKLARRRIPEIEPAAIWVYHHLASARLVEVAHELGVEVICWTVDEPDRVAELTELGVDGICSNDPRLLAGVNPPAS